MQSRKTKAWILFFSTIGIVSFILTKKAFAKDKNKIKTFTYEDPKKAAEELRTHLEETKKFGTKDYPNPIVAKYQRILQIADDGIVGPQTRAAAKKYNVTLPLRSKEEKDTVSTITIMKEVESISTEPEPAQVIKIPKERKGSLIVIVDIKLPTLYSLVNAEKIKEEMTKHISKVGPRLATCKDAPKLKGSPSIIVQDLGNRRFKITTRWAGTWNYSGISQDLKNCMLKESKKIAALNKILVGTPSIGRS